MRPFKLYHKDQELQFRSIDEGKTGIKMESKSGVARKEHVISKVDLKRLIKYLVERL